ncbi:MAG TPA: hypothetical protein VNN80_23870 [Polyangiaceae bacterium]|nr:hypothetical protein [Polyangiaceae bacterium]
MEGQREKTSNRRRQRRKAKSARGKVVVEPVLIAARRPDSPLLKHGFRNVVASAQPKSPVASSGSALALANGHLANGDTRPSAEQEDAPISSSRSALADEAASGLDLDNGAAAEANGSHDSVTSVVNGVRRRAARIVRLADNVSAPSNREQVLLDRLVSSQGRGAISRAANDLWESKIVVPKRQEIQIQLLEHENEVRARDAVFAMAELLQREAPIKRPVLDQRLRRLETSAEDPITRDAAGALRRSMRVHHGL